MMLGVWSSQHQFAWKEYHTTHDTDVPGTIARRTRLDDGSLNVKTCTEILQYETMQPWSRITLGMERVALAKGMHSVRRYEAEGELVVLGMHVDCVYFQWLHANPAAMERQLLSEHLRPSGKPMFQIKTDPASKLPANAPRTDLLVCEVPAIDYKWQVKGEAAFGMDGDAPDYQALAKKFLDCGGMQLTGAAGVGKTYSLKRILAAVRAELVERKAPTKLIATAVRHCTTQLIGGVTLEHVMRKYGASPMGMPRPGTVVVVDEMSEVRQDVWWRLAHWKRLGVLFLLTGDFDGQRGPMFDCFEDSTSPTRMKSCQLMHALSGGFRMELKTYRRGDDPELFANYTRLYKFADASPYQPVLDLQALYPLRTSWPDVFVVMKHEHRLLLNAASNLRLSKGVEDKLFVKCPANVDARVYMKPQDMHIWTGMTLVGCVQKYVRNGLKNGVLYNVVRFNAETVWLEPLPEYQTPPLTWEKEPVEDDGEEEEDEDDVLLEDAGEDGEVAQLSRHERRDGNCIAVAVNSIAEKTRLTHALVYAAIQGLTIRDKHLALMSCGHRCFSTRDLITGASRVTNGSFLHVCTREEEHEFLNVAMRETGLVMAECAKVPTVQKYLVSHVCEDVDEHIFSDTEW